MTIRIEVNNLSRTFGRQEALKNIHFSLNSGEVLGLIGHNGCGKTTALRCLAGILPPTSGSILINGIDLLKQPALAKKNLAYLPDNPSFFENLVAWEQVELIARIYGISGVSDFEKRARELFEKFGLSDRMTALGSEMSRGMRQRLSLICALIHSPQILLLDEPMLGLDPNGIKLMNDTLKEEAQKGMAVVISSHLLALLEQVCTKVLVLSSGKVQLYGQVNEVKKEIHFASERFSLEELFFYSTQHKNEGTSSRK